MEEGGERRERAIGRSVCSDGLFDMQDYRRVRAAIEAAKAQAELLSTVRYFFFSSFVLLFFICLLHTHALMVYQQKGHLPVQGRQWRPQP